MFNVMSSMFVDISSIFAAISSMIAVNPLGCKPASIQLPCANISASGPEWATGPEWTKPTKMMARMGESWPEWATDWPEWATTWPEWATEWPEWATRCKETTGPNGRQKKNNQLLATVSAK